MTSQRTYWNDAVEEWYPIAAGYQHPHCGRIAFSEFQVEPSLRPLLATCEGCGRVWERAAPRQAWRPAAAGGVRLRVLEPEQEAGQEPERRAA